jgi:hypothetical protein
MYKTAIENGPPRTVMINPVRALWVAACDCILAKVDVFPYPYLCISHARLVFRIPYAVNPKAHNTTLMKNSAPIGR